MTGQDEHILEHGKGITKYNPGNPRTH